jgi:hypothetical protein
MQRGVPPEITGKQGYRRKSSRRLIHAVIILHGFFRRDIGNLTTAISPSTLQTHPCLSTKSKEGSHSKIVLLAAFCQDYICKVGTTVTCLFVVKFQPSIGTSRPNVNTIVASMDVAAMHQNAVQAVIPITSVLIFALCARAFV